MTHPADEAITEPITEEWLLANGFRFDSEGYARFDISKKLYIETWCCSQIDVWCVEACNALNLELSVILCRLTTTARLIKLIEALTGKEWPCK